MSLVEGLLEESVRVSPISDEVIMKLRTIGLIGTLVLGLFPDRERWGNVSEI